MSFARLILLGMASRNPMRGMEAAQWKGSNVSLPVPVSVTGESLESSTSSRRYERSWSLLPNRSNEGLEAGDDEDEDETEAKPLCRRDVVTLVVETLIVFVVLLCLVGRAMGSIHGSRDYVWLARFLLDAILILLLLFMLTTLPITLYFHFTTGLHPETFPRVQATGAVISAACVFLVTMGWLGRTNNADSIIISVTGVMWLVFVLGFSRSY